MTTDTPCTGCPSPILPSPAPRMSELLIARNGVVYGVREYHPGCWDVERCDPDWRAQNR